MKGFKAISFWPFNLNAMDHMTKPSDAYTTKHVNISYENNDQPNGTINESNGGRMELHVHN